MAKYQSYVMCSATDFEVPGKCFEFLYFDGKTRGLEQCIVQNNLLFECRTIIGCATENQVRIAAGFK